MFRKKEVRHHLLVSVCSIKGNLLPDIVLFLFHEFDNGIELCLIIRVLVQEQCKRLIGNLWLIQKIAKREYDDFFQIGPVSF
ncbi:hypothetical protein ES705_48579 [subsurface metagenome]